MTGKLSKSQKRKIYYPLGGAMIGGIPVSFLWVHLIRKEGRTPTWKDRFAGFAIGAVPSSLIGFMFAQGKAAGAKEAEERKIVRKAMKRHIEALETCKHPTKKQRAWCKRKGYL